MKSRKGLSATLILLCFIYLMHSRCPAWAQSFEPLNLEPNRVLWSDLSFRASKAVVDVEVDIRLASFSTPEFESIWRTYPQPIPLPTMCQGVYNLEVNRIIDYIFSRPVRLWNQVLFDPQKANSFYRVRLRRGKDDIERAYWFSKEGVHRLRRMPNVKAEASLDPAKWTDVSTSFYPYDLARLECPQVVDPMLLIYLLSAAPIDKEGKVFSLCVFGKQQLHRVILRYQRLENLEVDYSLKSGEGKVRKKGKVDGLKVTIESVPLVSDKKDAENFSFLGMHEDIAIHLDSELRIPLQVNGKIPTVGLVTLKLSEATLRKPQ
jgi:hypothetical protein